MKRTFRNTVLSLAAAVLVATGCSKEFFDTNPTSAASESDIFSDTEAAMIAINGEYRLLWDSTTSSWSSQGAYPTFCIHLAALSDDFVFTYTNVMLQNTAEWVRHRDLTHKYNDLNYYWKLFYKIVNNSNKVLSYIDVIPNRVEGDDNMRWCVKAQAYALRGFAFHQLVQAWAERYYPGQENNQLGVIIRTEPSYDYNNPEKAFEPQARKSVEEVYKQILSDYDSSLVYFAKTSTKKPNKSHIDKTVARMLRARAYMCMGRYEEAAADCEIVYSEAKKGGAALSATIYTATDKENRMSDINNSEWMWGVVHSDDSGQYDSSRNWHDLLSNGVASYNKNSPRAILSTLWESIPETDVRKGLWIKNPWAKGVTVYTPKSGVKAMYMSNKFLIENNSTSKIEKDVPYMRLPEVILTMAEAYARSNNEGKAKQLVCELGKFRDPSYALSDDITKDDLIEKILWQRRVELWGEIGDRWFTLKRLNKDLDRGSLPREKYNQGPYTSDGASTNLDPEASNFNMYGAGLSEQSRFIPANSIKWQWLIPSQEINANALCEQNPL